MLSISMFEHSGQVFAFEALHNIESLIILRSLFPCLRVDMFISNCAEMSIHCVKKFKCFNALLSS